MTKANGTNEANDWRSLLSPRAPFLGAGEYEDARAVLFGVPMDFTVSFRPGSRLGPTRIREVSDVLEEYSLDLDRSLDELTFADLGDLDLPLGNPTASLERAKRVCQGILADGKMPIALGGEHLISLPLIEAVHERYPDLVVVQFDAHADLRDNYLGEKMSHATVMRRVVELFPDDERRLYQFGIRSATREEVEFAREHTYFRPFEVWEAFLELLPSLKGRPIYVTLDIDVFDPAYAPGTGTPEPGGVEPQQLFQAIKALGGCRIVGCDLVEVAPVQDPTERTAVLAAKLIREMLLSFV